MLRHMRCSTSRKGEKLVAEETDASETRYYVQLALLTYLGTEAVSLLELQPQKEQTNGRDVSQRHVYKEAATIAHTRIRVGMNENARDEVEETNPAIETALAQNAAL